MRWLTQDAILACCHGTGLTRPAASQDLVTVEDRVVAVRQDPVSRAIVGCPLPPNSRPCTNTKSVSAGYSDLVRIDERSVCLDSVTGGTDGMYGQGTYAVRSAGQPFVDAEA